MGNSAGAVHAATWLLEPSLAESRKSVQNNSLVLKGVILVSIPAHFQSAIADRRDVLAAYYRNRIAEDCAFGLLTRVQEVQSRVLVVTAALDPDDEILQPSGDFVDEFKKRLGGEKLTELCLEGHNHFSTVIGLGTGVDREESLGTEVLRWMKQA